MQYNNQKLPYSLVWLSHNTYCLIIPAYTLIIIAKALQYHVMCSCNRWHITVGLGVLSCQLSLAHLVGINMHKRHRENRLCDTLYPVTIAWKLRCHLSRNGRIPYINKLSMCLIECPSLGGSTIGDSAVLLSGSPCLIKGISRQATRPSGWTSGVHRQNGEAVQ